MPLSTSPGTSYTWGSAGWSWTDTRAGKTWATAYSAAYLETDSEALTASDFPAKLVGNNDSETFTAADARLTDYVAVDAEAIALAELQQDIIAFLRITAEPFALAELASRAIGAFDAEALPIAEAAPRSMTTPRSEAFAIDEARSAAILLPRMEAFALAEGYTDVIGFVRNAAEALSLAEARAAQAAQALAEAITAVESSARPVAFVRNVAEALTASDARSAALLMAFGELIAPAEVDAGLVAFSRDAAEPIGIAENYIDLIGFIVSSLENIGVAEASSRDATKRSAEALGVTEAALRQVAKAFAEALAASDSYVDLIGFINAVSESITLAEARRGSMTHRTAEALVARDALIRRINAVVADLAIRSTGMTQEQFEAMVAARKPLGNYPPKPLQPGDYRYERAILRILLEDAARTTRQVAVDRAKLTVDVPDITDRGSATLTTAGASVSFSRDFYDAPEVQVIQTSGTTRAIPSVTTITRTSFFVQLFDAASPTTPVAGTISWTALGK